MKKLPILLAVAVACLALVGCFKSKILLLDASQAAHPLPDGSSWLNEDSDRLTVTSTGFGYVLTEGDSRSDVVVTPLAGHAGAYAVAKSSIGCGSNPTDCEWEYAVISVDGDTLHQYMPSCDNQWAAISADVAGRNEGGDTCWFDSASGLQHALGLTYEAGSPYDYQRQ